MATLQEQVQRIASNGKLSRAQRLEDLVYLLGLSTYEALTALDVYKPASKPKSPKEVTFGVEIECSNVERALFVRIATDNGARVRLESYNHVDNNTYYKVVNDGSLMGENTAEIVSPILKGKDGLKSLKIICESLNKIGATVNSSCGLHVHLDARNMSIKHWRNLYINYARLEAIIDSFMPNSRRRNNNGYCRSIANYPRLEAAIFACNSIEDIRALFGSRYYKINAEAYMRHKTVEFRQHSGTTDYEKISMWVAFLQKLLAYSKHNTIENCYSIDDVPFLTKTEKQFFKNRITLLAS